jgi:hypothetical protein
MRASGFLQAHVSGQEPPIVGGVGGRREVSSPVLVHPEASSASHASIAAACVSVSVDRMVSNMVEAPLKYPRRYIHSERGSIGISFGLDNYIPPAHQPAAYCAFPLRASGVVQAHVGGLGEHVHRGSVLFGCWTSLGPQFSRAANRSPLSFRGGDFPDCSNEIGRCSPFLFEAICILLKDAGPFAMPSALFFCATRFTHHVLPSVLPQ